MNKIERIEDIDLRHLSSIYDTRDTYLSAIIPVVGNKYDMGYVNERAKVIEKALVDGDLKDNFLRAMDILRKILDDGPLGEERTLVAFISPVNDFREIHRLGIEVERAFVLDTSPYIRTLALAQDNWYDYALVLLDSENARIYIVSSDVVVKQKNMSEDIMKHHKKGGQSQMRFQRLRKGAVEAFMKEVIDALEDIIKDHGEYWRGIIIAGPGEAKKRFYAMLPQPLKDQVIDVMDSDFPIPERKIIHMADDIALEDEAKRSQLAVERVRELIFRNGPVAYGIDDVITAAAQGRVEILVIDDDTHIPGYICENCQRVSRTAPKDMKCPQCHSPLSQVDMVEEAIEFVERTDGEIEFVHDNSFLRDLGGIAAILRF